MTTKDVNAAIWAIEATEAVKRGILGPMYTRSIDDSMAVIQRRWAYYAASVGRGEDDVHQARLSVAHQQPLVDDGIRGYSNVSAAHALAIALLAALEAEQ